MLNPTYSISITCKFFTLVPSDDILSEPPFLNCPKNIIREYSVRAWLRQVPSGNLGSIKFLKGASEKCLVT
jgi:hypothetical protein